MGPAVEWRVSEVIVYLSQLEEQLAVSICLQPLAVFTTIGTCCPGCLEMVRNASLPSSYLLMKFWFKETFRNGTTFHSSAT